MSQFSVELLDPQLDENMVGFLNLSSARNFGGRNFCELVFDREYRENFCLVKISRYTVAMSFSTIPGQRGMKGEKGEPGTSGSKGDVGSQGMKGEKGATGATGEVLE